MPYRQGQVIVWLTTVILQLVGPPAQLLGFPQIVPPVRGSVIGGPQSNEGEGEANVVAPAVIAIAIAVIERAASVTRTRKACPAIGCRNRDDKTRVQPDTGSACSELIIAIAPGYTLDGSGLLESVSLDDKTAVKRGLILG